jgi:hydrogenase maturation factor
MNLSYGEVVEVTREDGMWMGRINVGGAFAKAALDLIDRPAPGQRVLLCCGVAIGKVEDNSHPEVNHVPRHSR